MVSSKTHAHHISKSGAKLLKKDGCAKPLFAIFRAFGRY